MNRADDLQRERPTTVAYSPADLSAPRSNTATQSSAVAQPFYRPMGGYDAAFEAKRLRQLGIANNATTAYYSGATPVDEQEQLERLKLRCQARASGDSRRNHFYGTDKAVYLRETLPFESSLRDAVNTAETATPSRWAELGAEFVQFPWLGNLTVEQISYLNSPRVWSVAGIQTAPQVEAYLRYLVPEILAPTCDYAGRVIRCATFTFSDVAYCVRLEHVRHTLRPPSRPRAYLATA